MMRYRSIHKLLLNKQSFAKLENNRVSKLYFSSKKKSSLIVAEDNTPTQYTQYKSPWTSVNDPTGKTELTYWWNKETNETTHLGKPSYVEY